MKYRYLTHQFVVAMALPPQPYRLPRNQGVAFMSEHGMLPVPGRPLVNLGVEFDGAVYLAAPDMLSWDRWPY